MRFEIFVYCNATDSPKIVGEGICRANSNYDKEYWRLNDEAEFYSIKVDSKGDCVAVVYSVSPLVVGIDIDNDCAPNVIEPLMEKYGFKNVKWLFV